MASIPPTNDKNDLLKRQRWDLWRVLSTYNLQNEAIKKQAEYNGKAPSTITATNVSKKTMTNILIRYWKANNMVSSESATPQPTPKTKRRKTGSHFHSPDPSQFELDFDDNINRMCELIENRENDNNHNHHQSPVAPMAPMAPVAAPIPAPVAAPIPAPVAAVLSPIVIPELPPQLAPLHSLQFHIDCYGQYAQTRKMLSKSKAKKAMDKMLKLKYVISDEGKTFMQLMNEQMVIHRDTNIIKIRTTGYDKPRKKIAYSKCEDFENKRQWFSNQCEVHKKRIKTTAEQNGSCFILFGADVKRLSEQENAEGGLYLIRFGDFNESKYDTHLKSVNETLASMVQLAIADKRKYQPKTIAQQMFDVKTRFAAGDIEADQYANELGKLVQLNYAAFNPHLQTDNDNDNNGTGDANDDIEQEMDEDMDIEQ